MKANKLFDGLTNREASIVKTDIDSPKLTGSAFLSKSVEDLLQSVGQFP